MKQSDHFEAIVVGGGPAGSTTAAVLAGHGRRVLVLEKERFPRYHIGESLIPFCYFPLKRIGMIDRIEAAGFVEKYSVQFVGMKGDTSQPFYFFDHMDHACTKTWQVERSRFDHMLLQNAEEKGARVLQETRVKNTLKKDGAVVGVSAVTRDGREKNFYAPITIDCSGRDGLAMNRNRWRIAESGLHKTAIWTYFKGAKRDEGIDEGTTTIAYVEGKGWFWYIPLADDFTSVGVVADKDYLFSESKDPEAVLWRELRKQPWVWDHVKDAEPRHGVRATGDYSYRSQFCARDGLVLAGDALTFLDPVFSSGVFLALVGGELVADAVEQCHRHQDFSAARFEDYSRKYRHGIEVMRKFVYAFYDLNFNFGSFMKKHPNYRHDLTDCLIGNVFQDLSGLFRAIGEFAALPESLAHGGPLAKTAAAAG